jgi:predicted transposase/invertase (TIGR01784 family)
VFESYFSDTEKLIEVYNAIEGKNYPRDAEVEINTLEDALFMERINDVSFLLDKRLIVLIEHQSTLSENFPLRMLLYISRLYEKILESDNIYRQRLIKIPKPDFIVLYNGDAEYPDRKELRLSDAFKDADIPDPLELKVRVYNINRGRNKEILQKSKSLGDYAAFIGRVKENKNKGLSADEAVREAVEYCISNGIMKDYLESNAAEVKNMLFTEWNWDDAKRVWREEALEEGMEKGMEKGLEKGLEEGMEKGLEKGMEKAAENIAVNLLRNGANPEFIAKGTGLSLEKILRLSERAMKN